MINGMQNGFDNGLRQGNLGFYSNQFPSLQRNVIFANKNYAYRDSRLPKIYEKLAGNLVMLYDFSEAQGLYCFDKSGKNNTGTLSNFDTVNCWNNAGSGGLQGDGVNDIVSIPSSVLNNLTGCSGATVELWMQRLNTPGTNGAYPITLYASSSAGKITVRITNSNSLEIRARSNASESVQVKTLNSIDTNKNHIAGVINLSANTIDIYVNGIIQLTMGTISFAQNTYSNETYTSNLFAASSVGSSNFYGNLYKAALYNRILTSQEILNIYNFEKRFIS